MFLDLGPVVRNFDLRRDDPRLFLTFDDGPNNEMTPKVLDLLSEFNAKATFFVIARNAQNERQLIQRMVYAGHGIGNHSLDHNTLRFFSGRKALQPWIREAQDVIEQIAGTRTVGFRSPVGIQTPSLHQALMDLDIPLVHWNMRFYDTNLGFSTKRSMFAAHTAKTGSIMLLHDRHFGVRAQNILESLRVFLEIIQKRQKTLAALTREETRLEYIKQRNAMKSKLLPLRLTK